jgi:hypothetical protein
MVAEVLTARGFPQDVQDLTMRGPEAAASGQFGRIVWMLGKILASPQTSDADSSFLMTDSRL